MAPKGQIRVLDIRKRQVKCDETKPSCQKLNLAWCYRCVKNDFACEGPGYGLAQSQVNTHPSSACALRPLDHQRPQPAIVTSRFGVECAASQEQLMGDPRPLLQHVLAGGKLDPFNAFCVDSTHYEQQIFDHAIHSQWSLFAPSQGPGDLAMVKQNIMSYAIHSPVSYYALLYAGACHKHFWQKSFYRTTERDPELIQLKLRATRALREAIRRSESHDLEDILVSTVLLAAHDGGDEARRQPLGKVQGRKLLAYSLGAEFYCALDFGWGHLSVFYDLLQRCDGIMSIRPGAIQTATIIFDIFNAYLHSTAPRIPALVPLTATLTMRNWSQDDTALLLASKLGKGFGDVYETFPDCTKSTRLQQVLQGFVNTIIDFDHIDRSKLESFEADQPRPHEPTITLIRSTLIHELLTIPELPTTDSDLWDDHSMLVYELCRLSCLMFCQAWGFADSGRVRRMARTQVLQLISILKRARTAENTRKLCSKLPEFYTWIVVLGLMLAYEDLDAFCDAACIMEMAPFLAHSVIEPRTEAWPMVSTTMSGFLWLWKDCEVTRKEAWNYGCHLLTTD